MTKESEENEHNAGLPRRPFGYIDLDFFPASPAQGPFFELLLHAPQYGLPLIRKLVDYAISFMSGGLGYGTNAMTVVFPDVRERVFPWHQSYGWSRDWGGGSSIVTSALMALESWAHDRIEAKDPIDRVIDDVIGAGNAPAAYLLLVVDLLLSHWPKSQDAAIPFLACPELLCFDRQREVVENNKIPDIFGVEELLKRKEPIGKASLDSLKERPSRRRCRNRSRRAC